MLLHYACIGSEYELKEVEIENCKYLPCPLFMNGETKVHVKMEAGNFYKIFLLEIHLITSINIHTLI